jgi:hypothetical protein
MWRTLQRSAQSVAPIRPSVAALSLQGVSGLGANPRLFSSIAASRPLSAATAPALPRAAPALEIKCPPIASAAAAVETPSWAAAAMPSPIPREMLGRTNFLNTQRRHQGTHRSHPLRSRRSFFYTLN